MRTRVWDLPTRLFHWGLAAAVAVALWTGDDARSGAVHVAAGWIAAGLVGFRLAWGRLGERWSRWDALGHEPGHGRWASVSVVAALSAVALLAATGAVVLGGEELRGPLAGVVPPAAGVAVHRLHGLLGWGLLAWLGVHLAGVAHQSLSEGQGLVRGMIDGRKRWDGAPVRARGGAALGLIGAIGIALGWAAASADRPALDPGLAQSGAWGRECGDCHLAFHPSLLPARSWEGLLAPDADHFGEVLGLDPETTGALGGFARANAAERGQTEHAVRIAAEGGAPARVVETRTWRGAHEELTPEALEEAGGRLQCAACHPDAEAGAFDGRLAEVPAEGVEPDRASVRVEEVP